jgi:hypothetical protein
LEANRASKKTRHKWQLILLGVTVMPSFPAPVEITDPTGTGTIIGYYSDPELGRPSGVIQASSILLFGLGGPNGGQPQTILLQGSGPIISTANFSVSPSGLFLTGNASVTGTLQVDTDIVLPASDCAEEFDVVSSEAADPGTVMVVDEGGALRASDKAYDKKVAGVVSGAGAYRPGMILGKTPSPGKRVALGLIGKVYCKVDAQYSPIEVGDLLTTSPTNGHAMKATDPLAAFGCVIGKALAPFSQGQGLIPILISLQ